MIFQSSMGPWKSKCDVPSGTTQGCFCPFSTPSLCCLKVCLSSFAHQWIGFWSATHVWLWIMGDHKRYVGKIIHVSPIQSHAKLP
jgi:hypothetical protein